MKIYEHKVIGKGKKIINILFHKSYIKKKSFYHYFWLKNINNIQKKFKKGFVCVICYDKFSTSKALNRHLLLCNALTKEEYPAPGTFLSYDDKKLQNMLIHYLLLVLLILKQNLTLMKMLTSPLKILSKVMKVLR